MKIKIGNKFFDAGVLEAFDKNGELSVGVFDVDAARRAVDGYMGATVQFFEASDETQKQFVKALMKARERSSEDLDEEVAWAVDAYAADAERAFEALMEASRQYSAVVEGNMSQFVWAFGKARTEGKEWSSEDLDEEVVRALEDLYNEMGRALVAHEGTIQVLGAHEKIMEWISSEIFGKKDTKRVLDGLHEAMKRTSNGTGEDMCRAFEWTGGEA